MLITVKGNAVIKTVIFILLVTLFSPVSVFAQSPFVGPSPFDPIQSGPVTIISKSDDAIWIKERIFLVTEATKIMDEKGKLIQLKKLPIPCEANIEYEFGKQQDPICLKIIVGKQKRER